MSNEQMLTYGILSAFVLLFVYRRWKFKKVKGQLPELKRAGALIVDVRSPAEFRAGANPQSRNIPLERISADMASVPKDKPIVVCCASGGRSAIAMQTLKSQGFTTVVNAGAWTNTL